MLSVTSFMNLKLNPTTLTLDDLDFAYPDELVATEPVRPTRVMWVDPQQLPVEISISDLLQRIPAGDVFVINNSRVLPRRVFSQEGFEILFIQEQSPNCWEVLFPARKLGHEQIMNLPGGITARLKQMGLPQIIEVSNELNDSYFAQYGELALPPYIQKERGLRHQVEADVQNYQTAWAQKPGSLASPTASLHFSQSDMDFLKRRGVHVVTITLHVGLGTFLPIKTNNLAEHVMHAESVEIANETWETIVNAKRSGRKVWALGTTVARALESAAQGLLQESTSPATSPRWYGLSRLFIVPGYEYKIVDCLLTNFHQPKSTLVALVAAFADLAKVKSSYAWAIERRFRLFSYGDLSVWLK